MKLNKKTIKLLAAHWVKDERTIRRWIKNKNPMLSHQDSQNIINQNKTK